MDENEFDFITCDFQVSELTRVLGYKRLSKRVGIDLARTFLRRLETRAIFVKSPPAVDASSDPDDNVILATALAGHADLVVSGDKRHMLNLRQISGISIVSAQEALSILRAPS